MRPLKLAACFFALAGCLWLQSLPATKPTAHFPYGSDGSQPGASQSRAQSGAQSGSQPGSQLRASNAATSSVTGIDPDADDVSFFLPSCRDNERPPEANNSKGGDKKAGKKSAKSTTKSGGASPQSSSQASSKINASKAVPKEASRESSREAFRHLPKNPIKEVVPAQEALKGTGKDAEKKSTKDCFASSDSFFPSCRPAFAGENTIPPDRFVPSEKYAPPKPSGHSRGKCPIIAPQEGSSLFLRPHISHIEAKGFGYDSGYTTLGLFASNERVSRKGDFEPFFDLRGHYFNNAKWALNIGGGVRYLHAEWEKVLGANIYYDFRHGKTEYHQLGIGLEVLGLEYDLRMNTYLPIGNPARHNPWEEKHYTNPSLSYARFRMSETLLRGVDFEIETNLKKWYRDSEYDLFAAIGPYYYREDCECNPNIYGGRARVGARFMEYVTLELIGSYDTRFEFIGQGRLVFSIPFGRSSFSTPSEASKTPNLDYLESLATQPVNRQEIIALDDCCEYELSWDRH